MAAAALALGALPPAASASLPVHWSAAASAFVPSDDDATWGLFTGGCIYRSGGASHFNVDLHLPQGAEITVLRLYFYDGDPSRDAAASIYSFDGLGNFEVVASTSSSGTPGQSAINSLAVSHVVDNPAETLVVRISFADSASASLRICGVRIRYNPP